MRGLRSARWFACQASRRLGADEREIRAAGFRSMSRRVSRLQQNGTLPDQMLLRASISMQRPVVEAKKPIEAVLKEGAALVVIVVFLSEGALFLR